MSGSSDMEIGSFRKQPEKDETISEAAAETEKALDGYDCQINRAELKSKLAGLLADPVLADVPRNPTLSDVVTLVSLERGSAMRVTIVKLDGSIFEIAIMNSDTVKDLKLEIKKKVSELEQADMGHRHISWKHVWSNFCLAYHKEKLLDDNEVLQDIGIRNGSQVSFIPYVKKKGRGRHSKGKKHRLFRGLNKTA